MTASKKIFDKAPTRVKVIEGRNEKWTEYMSQNVSAVGKWISGKMWTLRRTGKRKNSWAAYETEEETDRVGGGGLGCD